MSNVQRRPSRRLRLRRAIDAGVLLLISIFALFPILWGFSTSLKQPADIVRFPPEIIPRAPTLDNYAKLFADGILLNAWNSLLVSVCTVLLSLTLGLMAAYAVARLEFRGKSAWMFLVIAVMSIPLPSLMIPTFGFLNTLGLIDSRLGLILLYTAYQLPVVIWMLYGFIRTIPVQLELAAMIDGYSRFQILGKIVLPLTRTGLIAAGLFVTTFAWNDFIVALVMTSSKDLRTLPIAVYEFIGYFGREWGPLTAAAILSAAPVIAIFIVFQRFFLSGMTGGSVKG